VCAAGLLLAVLTLSFAPANGQEPTWVQILDNQAITINQLDPSIPGSVESGWNTGIVTLDNAELALDGYTGGFLQVVEYDPNNADSITGIWTVQNVPIKDPSVEPADSEFYTFAFQHNGPVNNIVVGVYFTAAPVNTGRQGGGNKKGAVPNGVIPAPRHNFPVLQVPLVIRPGVLYPNPTNVPIFNQVLPIDATQKDTKNDPLTTQDSVKQQVNQCAPASVADSLQYLMVNDGNMNVPSTQKNSRVGALDKTTGRAAGVGTAMLNLIRGKLAYINQKNLNLVVHHQGRFCPTANFAGPGCQQGVINDGKTPPGMVTSTPGNGVGNNGVALPDASYITSELDNKEDVEMCFAWVGGAHCVQVTGYNWQMGYLALTIIQDPAQGNNAVPTTPQTPGAHMTVHVGTTGDGRLWILDWPSGPAQIGNVISESPGQ
jgi:hypothetical protein